MLTVGDLTIGWVDTDIRAVCDAGVLSRFESVLITSVDSTIDISASALGQAIAADDPSCQFFGSGIVVRGDNLENVAKKFDLFNGFDELWCFESFPELTKPEGLWIVSPFNIETDLAPGLVSWMAQSNCILGLGDGVGLNFVTPKKEMARLITGAIAIKDKF